MYTTYIYSSDLLFVVADDFAFFFRIKVALHRLLKPDVLRLCLHVIILYDVRSHARLTFDSLWPIKHCYFS